MCSTPAQCWTSWKTAPEPNASSNYSKTPLERTPVLVSVMNWGEVFYQSWQQRGEESARRTLADLCAPSDRIDSRRSLASSQAGELKAVHKIPYVDSLWQRLAILRTGHLSDFRPRLRKARTAVSDYVARSRIEHLALSNADSNCLTVDRKDYESEIS